MDPQKRWDSVFEELRSVRCQLQDLEQRRESYDLIFVTRQYIGRLQRTLDALTPHFLDTSGIAEQQLMCALKFMTTNVAALYREAETLKETAKRLNEESLQKEYTAASIQLVMDSIGTKLPTD